MIVINIIITLPQDISCYVRVSMFRQHRLYVSITKVILQMGYTVITILNEIPVNVYK